MLTGKFRTKWRLAILCAFIAMTAIAGAQEPGNRIPGRILSPEYSGILLMESREKSEPPDKILQFMGLRDGDVVADIGCGNGFYALPLAKKIAPHGVVFAVDVQQGMLDQLAERQAAANVSNIYPVLGGYEDPLLPPGKVDWILLVDAYHEFSNPEAMLARMKESLAPGGRVALIEYRGERSPGNQGFPVPSDHAMTVEQVMKEWIPAGFELVTRAEFLPVQHFFVFRNAGDSSRPAIRKLAVGNTPNVSTFDHRVYFAGQPDEEALREFADLGVRTVINLRYPQEPASLGFDAEQAVKKAGMTYIHAPMGFEIPDAPALDKIMGALDTAGDAPVLMFCFNSNRVGTLWSLYAGQRGNLSVEDAIAEGKAAGMRLPALEKAAREALLKH